MLVSNTSRFSIYKNAIEYIQSTPTLIAKHDICSAKNYTLKYNWENDFKSFFRIDSQKAEQILKFYPETSLLLQNIYWDDIYLNVEKSAQDILEKITKNTTKPKLSIINISPLEWAILWKIFNELGLKNVVFNFNRTLWVNSTSKTLEAILYLFSYENSPYFRNKTSKIVQKIQNFYLNLQNEKNYIIIDENNNKEQYSHLSIDNYLKHQIGQKEPKNIYRLDKYPDEIFLLGKNISEIILFDNDNNYWQAHSYYEQTLKTIKIKKEKYSLEWDKSIWYYEDYLIEQNNLYKNYKKNIEQKAFHSYKAYENIQDSPKVKETPNLYAQRKSTWKQDKNYKIIPYILVFPILFMAFLISYNSENDSSWSSGGWSWGWYYYGWSLGWWDNTTISTPSTESKSVIKSFWGWGFSKGTT